MASLSCLCGQYDHAILERGGTCPRTTRTAPLPQFGDWQRGRLNTEKPPAPMAGGWGGDRARDRGVKKRLGTPRPAILFLVFIVSVFPGNIFSPPGNVFL